MQFIRKTILTTLIAFWSLFVFGLSTNMDSLRYEILLSNKILLDINVNESLIHSLDITSNRLILLSTPSQYYLLGWGGMVPFSKRMLGNINSFAFSPDSSLLTIRNNELCYFDTLGNLSVLYKLPHEGMGISAGENVMYIYDRNENRNALYVLAHRGKYIKLFEIPTTINSVVEYNNSLLFATESTVFRFDPKNKELKVFAALPKNEIIKSIAVNTSSSRIYFSTSSMIYAIKDSSAALITDKFGGILRFFNDGLLVFNPEKKFLIRIVGLEGKIASMNQPMKTAANDKQILDALTNTSIIDMVKQKLSDGIIINIINRSIVDFNLSVDSMIYLSSQNVSSAVIMAMKNAMKRKTSNVSNDANR